MFRFKGLLSVKKVSKIAISLLGYKTVVNSFVKINAYSSKLFMEFGRNTKFALLKTV